jgi:hypothetical protein
VREVEHVLIVGIGMGRGHQAFFNTELVQEHFADRRQTISGTRGIRNYVVNLGVILIFIDA